MAGQGPVTPQSAVTSTQAGTPVTTGVGLNDSATLQSQIQNAIQNEPTLKNDTVNVRVNDSIIELSGNTQTGKEKETAYRIASSFAENRRVKDRITVSGRGTAANSQSTNPQGTNRPASSNSNPNNPNNPQNPNSQQNPSANNPAANGDASTNPR
jgi:osmotically-inducible protein OsmY